MWVGTGLATRLPERGLRPALGIVMFTSGLALLNKAGVDVPAWVLVTVPIALGAASWAILRGLPRHQRPQRGTGERRASEEAASA